MYSCGTYSSSQQSPLREIFQACTSLRVNSRFNLHVCLHCTVPLQQSHRGFLKMDIITAVYFSPPTSAHPSASQPEQQVNMSHCPLRNYCLFSVGKISAGKFSFSASVSLLSQSGRHNKQDGCLLVCSLRQMERISSRNKLSERHFLSCVRLLKTQFSIVFSFIQGEMKGICRLGDKLFHQHDIWTKRYLPDNSSPADVR